MYPYRGVIFKSVMVLSAILKNIQEQILKQQYVMKIHVDEKMNDDNLMPADIEQAILTGTGSLRGDTELKALLYKVFTGLASKTRKYRLCKGLRCFITR